jgi:toxin ParE1/3/4
MTSFVLSPRAQADIEEIWDYTAERWGLDRAEHYIRDIERAIRVVADETARGRACDDIRRGYHKFSVGSHVLFYRSAGDQVEIVRILHRRMDFPRHL